MQKNLEMRNNNNRNRRIFNMLENEKDTEWFKNVFEEFDAKRQKNLEKYEMRDVEPEPVDEELEAMLASFDM